MPRIATSDEQLESVLNDPTTTQADADFARTWARGENARRAAFGMDWVRAAKARTAARCEEVSKEMYDHRQTSIALEERAQKGDYDSVDDLLKLGSTLRRQLVTQESAIAAIETTEVIVAQVESDPSGYYSSFYEKWPALAHQVPTLHDALQDRRRGL